MKNRILLLTTINDMTAWKEAVESIIKEHGDIVEVKKVYFDEYEKPDSSLEALKEEIENSDVIIVDIRGDIRIARELPELLRNENKTVVTVVAGGQHIWKLINMGKFRGDIIFNGPEKEFNVHTYVKMKKFSELTKKLGKLLPVGMLKDMKNWVLSQQYFAEGDAQNIKNLILLLLKEYCGVKTIKKVSPPTSFDYGLYLPGIGIIKSIKEYKEKLKYNLEKPTVAILMYGGMHLNECKIIADSIYKYLKDSTNLIFIAAKVENNIKALKEYLDGLNIDILLNLQYFRIHGGPYGGEPGPTYELLERLNVPVIIGLKSYSTDIEKWQASKEGLDPLEVVIGVTLPELDGAIEPLFISSLVSYEDPCMCKIKLPIVLEDRLEKLAQRIKNWLSLRRKMNSEKRIAIITYNYPPGEENLANAGYLDVFESMKIFLEKLKSRGYDVSIPENSLKDLFLSSGVVNSPNYLQKQGIGIPTDKYISWFKKLPQNVQEEVIKHWGQPPGDIMVEKNYILIPGVILRNIFLGIQPSRGVHEDLDKTYHDKNLPPHHQYLAYYLFLQKEFCADAVVHFGMHGTLEFTKGKEVALSSACFPDILIGNIPHIYYYWIGNPSESTIAKRRSYAVCISHASPPMKSSGLYEKYAILENLLKQYEKDTNYDALEEIKDLAEELHLPTEISLLKKELYKMKRKLIPYRLHIIDRKLNEEELIEYLLGVLRIDREYQSIFKLVSNREGIMWNEIKETEKANEIESKTKEVIKKILNNEKINWLPEGYEQFVKKIAANIQSSKESENLLNALEGKYIFPYRGGDPIRDPDVYPSGRAMYGFDPRLIPTVSAEVRGKKAAELLIYSYLKKYGKYPESVGIVLWGFETMKTGGDTIATILSLLGVKIKHKKSLWFKELEIISLEELKRPRIDVVITICGIFRDTFSTHIDLLNRAIEMVANLDEPLEMNFVKKHYFQMKRQLNDFGIARIFGPPPTEYATSMRTLIENSRWKDEKDLVESYDDSMSYAYFRGRIEENKKAFYNILKTVDIVTQERDNTEYEVTDLDHYYEFLGGLAKSVQYKKSTQSEIQVIDSTEDEIAVDDLKVVIERATRTRLLNPKWIEGMLKHDFHGAKKIKDRVEYLLAFAATTNKVENWIFDEVANKMIFDNEMIENLKKNNPYATIKIAELLIEAQRRAYWKVEEEKLERLKEIILKMESDVE